MRSSYAVLGFVKSMILGVCLWVIVLVAFYPSKKDSINSYGETQKLNRNNEWNIHSKMYNEMGLNKREVDFYKLNKVNFKQDDFWTKTTRSSRSQIRKKLNERRAGEMGKAVSLPSNLPEDVKNLIEDGWRKNEFNQYVSDLISVRRTLPDMRSNFCKEFEKNYSKNLPATSVIIIFYNEAWSTLLRSVHSVLDRSPEHLITEVILVDDFSDMDHLGTRLDEYFATYPKVKILRSEKREGLIRARITGTEIAKGPVLTFLDSHIEATEGWLEPLLDRIASDPTKVVCPVIEMVDDNSFKFMSTKDPRTIQIGGFDWKLTFRWQAIPEREHLRRNNSDEPIRSPTMAGGLFSIDKSFFDRLGQYDDRMEIWGAENLELSFKTWMCGGTLEVIPCSHVGHIFRKKSPYLWQPGVNVVRKNSIRLAEVWLDEYKNHFYARTSFPSENEFEDVSARKQLRNNLECKSFKWYLDNIYPEQYDPENVLAQGNIRSLAQNNISCITTTKNYGKPPELKNCYEKTDLQFFVLTKIGEIRHDDMCIDLNSKRLKTLKCQQTNGTTQGWQYDYKTNQISQSLSNQCLSVVPEKDELNVELCDERMEQKWLFEKFKM